MPSIDALPPDQRAVLELVLRRGRTYDEIAQLLSIDRAGVRQRALSALDALGPEAAVPAERRALITDYLLGALPPRVTEQVRDRLAQSPAERAWARVIAAELEPIAARPLPEIPAGPGAPRPEPVAPPRTSEREPEEPEPAAREPLAVPEETAPRRGRRRERAQREKRSRLGPRPPIEPGRERPPSRRGGKLVLLAAALIILIIVLSIALGGGPSKSPHKTAGTTTTTPGTSTLAPAGSTTGTTTTTPSTGTTTTPGSSAKIVAQVNLKPPSGSGTEAGIAEVLKAGSNQALAILAQHLTPNTKHNAYAVWLYNTSTDSHLLGFVSPPVGSNGQLRTEGSLPSNVSHYHHLIITVETQASPKTPGTIILEGTLTGIS